MGETVTVKEGDKVIGADDYEVVKAGTYNMLDLVPCRRIIDTNGPICAFTGATVAGLDPNEVVE